MKLLAPAPGWTATADVIVVGSGIAGLTTALQCRTFGLSVLLVTKARVDEGSTKWAQGGIAAALGPGDSPDQHEKDTLDAGAGLCDVARGGGAGDLRPREQCGGMRGGYPRAARPQYAAFG